jgi:hypothetical protein
MNRYSNNIINMASTQHSTPSNTSSSSITKSNKKFHYPFLRSGCAHNLLPQIRYGNLPPLYITSPLKATALTHLETSLTNLGTPIIVSPAVGREVTLLREELEHGMTKERRVEMQLWVRGLSPQKRGVAELYLARHPGFFLDGDGRMSYGSEQAEIEARRQRGDALTIEEEASKRRQALARNWRGIVEWFCGWF